MTQRTASRTRLLDLGVAAWRTSSHSQDANACVEIAFLPHGDIAVRHSKRPDAGMLIYTSREWGAFVKGAKDGEFDLP